ncbi:MAG: hypothetical protein QOI66_3854 [Myxococcales bacterium]|jgi:hypothetical protein|nr:hypothetical protein [Myxococcales bacterium]
MRASNLILVLAILVSAALGPAKVRAAALVEVRATSDCPSAAAVQTALQGLLSAVADAPASDVADLEAQGDAVVIRLHTAGGAFVAEKRLPPELSCAERAAAAAVILATWEARLQSGARASLPLPPAQPATPAGPQPPAAPRPPSAPPAAAAASTAENDLTARPALPPPMAPAPAEDDSWRIFPGVGVFGSFQGGGMGAGAAVEAELASPSSSFSAGVGAFLASEHQAALSSGQAVWSRMGGSIDGRWRKRLEAMDVEWRLAFVLARLEVEGRSFPSTGYDILVDPGATFGVRLIPQGKTVRPWLDLAATYWPRQRVLFVSGTEAGVTLPHVDLMLGLGMSFGQRL